MIHLKKYLVKHTCKNLAKCMRDELQHLIFLKNDTAKFILMYTLHNEFDLIRFYLAVYGCSSVAQTMNIVHSINSQL